MSLVPPNRRAPFGSPLGSETLHPIEDTAPAVQVGLASPRISHNRSSGYRSVSCALNLLLLELSRLYLTYFPLFRV